jgi:hypothetical protein
MNRIPKDKTHRSMKSLDLTNDIKNKPKDNRVIPDPIDERKFQE